MGSGIFSLGTSSLIANQSMMNTVSHNIANANTPGYYRQQAGYATDPNYARKLTATIQQTLRAVA